jgi:menaquinone-dependent protoporphyrinogen oxidase
MKKAIVFTSKFGATQRTADYIAKALGADLIDLRQRWPALSGYDMIIFGSGIYMGKMPRSMRTFVTNHLHELKDKKMAVFVCCTFDGDKAERQLALATEYMGTLVARTYMSGRHKGELGIDITATDFFIKTIESIS